MNHTCDALCVPNAKPLHSRTLQPLLDRKTCTDRKDLARPHDAGHLLKQTSYSNPAHRRFMIKRAAMFYSAHNRSANQRDVRSVRLSGSLCPFFDQGPSPKNGLPLISLLRHVARWLPHHIIFWFELKAVRSGIDLLFKVAKRV